MWGSRGFGKPSAFLPDMVVGQGSVLCPPRSRSWEYFSILTSDTSSVAPVNIASVH